MVLDNAERKRLLIIEAAARRFAHFGLAKTTMAEIAKDLSMSKASLYYYFPDKNGLFAAVFAQLVEEISKELGENLDKMDDPFKAIVYVLDVRMAFITKYYNLLKDTVPVVLENTEEIDQVMLSTQQKEVAVLVKVLQMGITQGILKVDNPEETAQMILYALVGMRFGILNAMKDYLFPTKEEFDSILKLQKDMCIILLKGLRPEWTFGQNVV